MPVPDYQSLMLPTLKALSDGVETSISDLRARIAAAEGVTAESASEKLPSGRQTVFANRVGWAVTYMERAGLVSRSWEWNLEPAKVGPVQERWRGRCPAVSVRGEAQRWCSAPVGGIAGLGGLPRISLPTAELEGPPLGLSLNAPRGADMQLLRLARRLMPEAAVQPHAVSSQDRRRAPSDRRAGRRTVPRGRCARAPAHRHGRRP